MPRVSGKVVNISGRVSTIKELWIRAINTRPVAGGIVTSEPTKVPIDTTTGQVAFDASEGQSVLVLVHQSQGTIRGSSLETIPIVVGKADISLENAARAALTEQELAESEVQRVAAQVQALIGDASTETAAAKDAAAAAKAAADTAATAAGTASEKADKVITAAATVEEKASAAASSAETAATQAASAKERATTALAASTEATDAAEQAKRQLSEVKNAATEAKESLKGVVATSTNAVEQAQSAASQASTAASTAESEAAKAAKAKEDVQAELKKIPAQVATELAEQIKQMGNVRDVDMDVLTHRVIEKLKTYDELPVTPGTANEAKTKELVAKLLAESANEQITAAVKRQVAEAIASAGEDAVINILPQGKTDITADLQAAINDPKKKVIFLPAGEWDISDTIILDKAAGKVIQGKGRATILNVKPGLGKNAMHCTSGAGFRDAYIADFVLDMQWNTGDRPATALQLTNADFVDVSEVKVRRSGGNAFLIQGYALKDKPTGNGSNDNRLINCVVDGAGLKQNTVQEGASGFGCLVKDNSKRNQIIGLRIRGVSCGMGIGGTQTNQGAPVDTQVLNNSVLMAENATIAFEPCGFTINCHRTVVVGNSFPVSKDNGISIGAYSVVTGNTIGSTWNHGIACSGPGTIINANNIWNVGIENSTRLAGSPVDWAAVAFEDPKGCQAQANYYAQDDPQADCAHMVKVVLKNGTPRSAVGGNSFIMNIPMDGVIKKELIKNGNFNPDNPDVIITKESWQEMMKKVQAVSLDSMKYLDKLRTRDMPIPGVDIHPFALWGYKGRRYSEVSYSFPNYWKLLENNDENWADYAYNPMLSGPKIANPKSGVGTQKEQEFADTLTLTTMRGFVNIAYVKTQWAGRLQADIIKEIDQYIEYYTRNNIHGVFLDEAINGWSEEQRAKVSFYTELYSKLRGKYGSAFYIVANPGGNTVEAMLGAADTLMSFEQSAEKYLKETVMPAHYRGRPPLRFWHAIHNCPDVETARKCLTKAGVSNVGHMYITNDTFTGVLGSENDNNNPWDGRIDRGIRIETLDWVEQVGFYRNPPVYKPA